MTTAPTVLYYSPKQKASIFLETLNDLGARTDADGYLPSVTRIIFPDLSLAPSFPQNMIKLDTGLYYFQYTLPAGGTAIGSYLVDVAYFQPVTAHPITAIYQLIVNAPFGSYSITI